MELRNIKREKLKRVRSYHPMERGYAGTKWGGRPVQNPDPIGDGKRQKIAKRYRFRSIFLKDFLPF